MKLDEKVRRGLMEAWEDADTLEDAMVAIQQVIEAATPALVRIEDREFSGNVYNDPEKSGLEVLATANKEPDYDFDMVVLWRDLYEDRYFMASDSGCSCPSPFEDVRSVSDLTEVRTRSEAQAFVANNVPYGGYDEGLPGMLSAIKSNLPAYA